MKGITVTCLKCGDMLVAFVDETAALWFAFGGDADMIMGRK